MNQPMRRTRVTPATKSAAAWVQALRRVISAANASPTLQEGLYRAYLSDLWHLARFDDGQGAVQLELRAAIAELQVRLGFDKATGIKIAPSSLSTRRATAILTRLETLAARGEALVTKHDVAAAP